jgi:hypothetical protein
MTAGHGPKGWFRPFPAFSFSAFRFASVLSVIMILV